MAGEPGALQILLRVLILTFRLVGTRSVAARSLAVTGSALLAARCNVCDS